MSEWIKSALILALSIMLLVYIWGPRATQEEPSVTTEATTAQLWRLTEQSQDGSLSDHYVVAQTVTQALEFMGEQEHAIVHYGSVPIPIRVVCSHDKELTEETK